MTPANVNKFSGCHTDEAGSIAADGIGYQAPVVSIAAREDLSCDWHSSQRAAKFSISWLASKIAIEYRIRDL
jgi:hypothetical protein